MDHYKTLTVNKNLSKSAAPARSPFNEQEAIKDLKHYLPAQSPLKDFVHHNTLHAFQSMKFTDARHYASKMFGYKTALSIEAYRELYSSKQIREDILEMVIIKRKGLGNGKEWINKVRFQNYNNTAVPRIGALRAQWKKIYKIDLDAHVHPFLFRVLCSYLDQGISIWSFPIHKNFLSSVRELERTSFTSFFKTTRAKKFLLHSSPSIEKLLNIIVGDVTLYKQYLFDQQFSHPGWSGMVSVIEENPHSLLDQKKVSLHDLIYLELLLEIDALDHHFGKEWQPLGNVLTKKPLDLFASIKKSEYSEIQDLWQEAYEWSYYDQVLAGIKANVQKPEVRQGKKFQAMFCIDDRGFSFQHYLEKNEQECETFGTPGFFNVEFFYQPLNGRFLTKLCPAPITPQHLIKELGSKRKHRKDLHFTKYTHTLFRGWLTSQALGFWSAVKLFIDIFKPAAGPATATSFSHMDKISTLTVENKNPQHREKGLQVGFTIEEMTARVEGLLTSIGLVKDFAPVIYVVGHGSSSVNNPHYAAYNCGACLGRPGSVNARVFSFMANHYEVRKALKAKGIVIPDQTQFVGALHDTARDEIIFYDEDALSNENKKLHRENETLFNKALTFNAKERARRFELMDNSQPPERVAEKIKLRSVSLFEPRPEYNHATNSVCIVGRRTLTRNVFLDRRAFLNSYDYRVDPSGKLLGDILKSAATVCGGINLEYFFSRMDNQKLGAGTKLPHNVMGLLGVANGIDGDLRPGLPSQMIEVHDPIRLLIIIEHFPEVVLRVIQQSAETYEWFINEWIHLVVVNPDTKAFYQFDNGIFFEYHPAQKTVDVATDINQLIENYSGNIPVHLIK